jgi:hypothetical protein
VGLALVALAGAVAVGLLGGGHWSRLTRLRLRWPAMVVAAVGAQAGGALIGVLGASDPRRAYAAGLAASAACAAVFCARNLRVAGVPLVTVGLVANAVVVAANGAMPVSIVAAYDAGVPIRAIAAGVDERHDIAGTGTVLRELGDVIPVPFPWRPEVVSAGDVLVAAGLAELVALGLLGRRDEMADEATS